MPPFTPTALHDEIPASLLSLVQQRLASLLGPGYSVILADSRDSQGLNQYHLAIQHNRSGLSLEDSGKLCQGFAERLLALGARTKAMLDSPTFARMADGNPDQLLVWISDVAATGDAPLAHPR